MRGKQPPQPQTARGGSTTEAILGGRGVRIAFSFVMRRQAGLSATLCATRICFASDWASYRATRGKVSVHLRSENVPPRKWGYPRPPLAPPPPPHTVQFGYPPYRENGERSTIIPWIRGFKTIYIVTDSTIALPQNQRFSFNERFRDARHMGGYY